MLVCCEIQLTRDRLSARFARGVYRRYDRMQNRGYRCCTLSAPLVAALIMFQLSHAAQVMHPVLYLDVSSVRLDVGIGNEQRPCTYTAYIGAIIRPIRDARQSEKVGGERGTSPRSAIVPLMTCRTYPSECNPPFAVALPLGTFGGVISTRWRAYFFPSATAPQTIIFLRCEQNVGSRCGNSYASPTHLIVHLCPFVSPSSTDDLSVKRTGPKSCVALSAAQASRLMCPASEMKGFFRLIRLDKP